MKKLFIRITLGSLASLLLCLGVIWFADYRIEHVTSGRTFDTAANVPAQRVGLVLGTAKTLTNGYTNRYFTYRINAVIELYKAGKIKYILVSGDNGSKSYDEPSDFKDELIQRGFPAHRIFLDYAGFRTLDSMVRAKEVFGLDKFIVISQKFHNQRAIYIADHHGIDAIGYNAQDASRRYGIKVELREYLARVKALIDVIIGTEPKFLGDPIEIK